MHDPATSQISEAMNRLWLKFLPQMQERVETLQAAASRLAGGTALTEAERSTAAADAHKLAGVLGTFGLKEGTELAREAETLFEGSPVYDSATTARVSSIAERLKLMIASRGEVV
jgi:HPt (histidine-containing phosphotransfer) domain-containing protein